ncbi:MAG: hypothetical protein QM640_04645 [Niabella sp.]
MRKVNDDGYYQGFTYPCKDMVKFVNTLGIFTIMLKNTDLGAIHLLNFVAIKDCAPYVRFITG